MNNPNVRLLDGCTRRHGQVGTVSDVWILPYNSSSHMVVGMIWESLGQRAPALFIHIPKVPRSRRGAPGSRLVGPAWMSAAASALVDIAVSAAPHMPTRVVAERPIR